MKKYYISLILLVFFTFPLTTNAQNTQPLPSQANKQDNSASNDNHHKIIAAILDRLDSKDPTERLKASIALTQVANETDIPRLATLLRQGSNPEKQLYLIEALGNIGDARVGDALKFELDHGTKITKLAAITALGKLGIDWPVPLLTRLLKNSMDAEIKMYAAASLGAIASTRAIHGLRSALPNVKKFPGAENAALWSLEKARGGVDDQVIDDTMPSGRRLVLNYKGMRYFLYHPSRRANSGPQTTKSVKPWLLTCIHDSDLRAEELFEICWRAGKQRNMAVLAPYFDPIQFLNYSSFNIKGARADTRLLELIEHIGKISNVNVREFYLFGYGTGGDFAQRMIMAYPERIAKAAFEANTFVTPNTSTLFPKGLQRNPYSQDIAIDIYNFLKTDVAVIFRKNSNSFKTSRDFFSAYTRYAAKNGIRHRMAPRTVEVRFGIWPAAERFLFASN